MSGTAIALPPEAFAQAFPFHLAVDSQLRIVQIGVSLARVCAGACIGDALADHFRIRQPHASPGIEQLRTSQRARYILDSTSGPLCLRGQVLVLPGDIAVFLCSPWVSSPTQLRELGLSLADFAPHDPMIDLIDMLESQQAAIEDTGPRIGETMRANQQLEEKTREASATTQAWRESEAAQQQTSATRPATPIGGMLAGAPLPEHVGQRERLTLPLRGHLLLVEDHPVNQDIALRQLGRLGFTADVAGNGREALAHLAAGRERYRLVLMDCHMPEMDGYACTRAIREAESGAGGHLPIVAMTASSQQSDRDASLRAGMDDFLSKPVRQEALAAVLQRWLPDAPPHAPPPPPAPRPQPGALLDIAQIADLQAFDADTPGAFAALCEAFFDECDSLLASLATARAAGDLVAAREAAHRLRGSCLNMGAARLAELAATAESSARRSDDTALAASFDALLAAAPQTRQAIARLGGQTDPLGSPEQRPRGI